MRSNGIAHIGNDTFIAATRDVDDQLHLFTGAFAQYDRLSAIELNRRAHVVPCEALSCSEADVSSMVDSLQRRAAKARKQQQQDTKTGSSDSNNKKNKNKSGTGEKKENIMKKLLVGDTRLLADAGYTDSDLDEGDDVATNERDLCRHSMHASCDGRRVVAISNHHRQHYVFDISRQPSTVASFETPEIIRAVCWHPTQPYILLTLSVTGVFTVYDTSASHLDVIFMRVQHVNLKPMIHAMRNNKHPPDAAKESERVKKAMENIKRRQQGKDRRATVTSSSPGGAADEGEGAATAGAAGDSEAAFPQHRRHTTEPLNDYGLPLNRQQHGAAAAAAAGKSSIMDDVRSAQKGTSSLQRPSAAGKHTKPSAAHTSNKKDEGDASAEKRAAKVSGNDGEDFDHSPTVFAHMPLRGRRMLEEGYKSIATLGTSDGKSSEHQQLVLAKETGQHDTIALLFAGEHKEEADADATSPLDLVDMCVVAPTRSLPATLLVLSSSGDVYAVKLSPFAMPAIGDVVLEDGRVPISKRSLLEELSKEQQVEVVPQVHHVVQGGGASNKGKYDEEALAVGCCCIDEDSGAHAIIVCCSSGVLRGAYVDEPDLISRHRACLPSLHHSQGASSLEVHLAATCLARTFLSPAVPSTTHTVHLSMVGQMALIRYGDAAYLVALPVWDTARQGWSHYAPRTGLRSAERQRTESWRLPLASQDAEVPPPLALKLPFEVRGASVGLGPTEVAIFAEEMHPDDAQQPMRPVVSCKVATLLRSAMLARSGKLSPHPAPHTGSSAEAVEMLDHLVECHQRLLCGHPPEAVDASTESLTVMVERRVAAIVARERGVQERQAAVLARLDRLSQRVENACAETMSATTTILNAIVNRRGAEAVVTGNERLGEIHSRLVSYEQQMAADKHHVVQQQTAAGKKSQKNKKAARTEGGGKSK